MIHVRLVYPEYHVHYLDTCADILVIGRNAYC